MKSRLFTFPLFVLGAALLGAACSTTVGTGSGPTGGGTDDVAVGGACTDDTECDTGDACDPQSGLCIVDSDSGDVAVGADCQDDGDCDSGDFCTDQGVCAADPDTTDGDTGADCGADDECSSGECDIDTDTCT